MPHSSPLLRHLRLGSLTTVLVATARLWAQAPADSLVTLAWSRPVHGFGINGIADSAGNTFALSDVPSASGKSMYLFRYDNSGNAVYSKKLYALPGFDVLVHHLLLLPTVSGQQFLYSQDLEIASKPILTFNKVNVDGTLVWSKTFGDSTHTFSGVNIGADAAGNSYLALANESENKTEILEYNAVGTLLHDILLSKMRALDGKFVNGKWFLNGQDPTIPGGSVKWGYYDPSTGSELASAKLNSLDNGNDSYFYNACDYVDSAGTVYYGVTVREVMDRSPYTTIATNHFLRCYSAAGQLLWTSRSLSGGSILLSGQGTASPVWCFASSNTGYAVEAYSVTGSQALYKTGFNIPFVDFVESDSGGLYLFGDSNIPPEILSVYRVGLSGQVVYSNTFDPNTPAPPGVSASPACHFGGTCRMGRNLYTFSYGPTTYKTLVQRYVTGITLASLSGPAGLTAHSVYLLKVQLNSPAPSGGLLVTLTSNTSGALFPNVGTTYKLAIPAGSIYANVPLSVGAVTSGQTVLLTADQNGVVRQLSLTAK